jgi:hypothetical protein
VVISDGIPDHIRGRLGIDFVDGGNREVKNIERALHIWTGSPQTTTPACSRWIAAAARRYGIRIDAIPRPLWEILSQAAPLGGAAGNVSWRHV